ncbi:N-acetyltransferase GCN5 [Stappia taiwanensis]|nr:GNAT family N-acetyltransferase [Stappia taiwanensis]GGF02695.1 N-acetyltransferase GCN5 [Stappia taiwanensis]
MGHHLPFFFAELPEDIMVADLEESLDEESFCAAGAPQETARLRLDLPRSDDLADIVTLANNRKVATMVATMPSPFTLDDGRALVARAAAATRDRAKFAIRMKSTGRFIGATGFHRSEEDGAIHLGYWLGEPFWGQGLATEAAQSVVDFIFCSTGTSRLIGAARVTNPASRRVLMKCGFHLLDQGMIHSRGAGGPVAVDRFGLDRSTWLALKRWGKVS